MVCSWLRPPRSSKVYAYDPHIVLSPVQTILKIPVEIGKKLLKLVTWHRRVHFVKGLAKSVTWHTYIEVFTIPSRISNESDGGSYKFSGIGRGGIFQYLK